MSSSAETFTLAELADLHAIIRAASRDEIMPRFAHLAAADIREKTNAMDLVTVADEASEAHIFKALAARWPGAFLLGEEAAERDASLVTDFAKADLAFVVDPIDGTFNFAHGIPAFAVIVAVVRHGVTVAGTIYDPSRDDFLVSIQGQGSWFEAKDGSKVPLRIAEDGPLSSMQGALSWYYLEEPLRSQVLARANVFWGTYSYRCGGQEMRLMAAGGSHFLVYYKLSPWDHAAGELILREAGCHICHFDGSAYGVTDRSGGLIFAPSEDAANRIRAALFD